MYTIFYNYYRLLLLQVLDFLTDGEFLPTSKLTKYLTELVCTPQLKLIDGLCEDVLFLVCGFDPNSKNFNQVCVHAGGQSGNASPELEPTQY